MNPSVLVVEDDPTLNRLLVKELRKAGYELDSASSWQEARERIAAFAPNLVLLDVNLPDATGFGPLSEIAGTRPVVMLTAYGSVHQAVEAMRLGAADYLVKPVNLDELELVIRGALERSRLQAQSALARGDAGLAMIGESAAMQMLRQTIREVGASDVTVLIQGESGSGKELVAQALHSASRRRGESFVAVDCCTLQEALFESELFGHERGAFTGADRRKAGLIEAAAHGTLFLDEIGEAGPAIQAKLLRVLETGRFRHVGATTDLRSDARIVAATNRNLQQRSRDGQFREDLYYRLSAFVIQVPPLRDRRDDIDLLAAHFIASRRQAQGLSPAWLMPDALARLVAYDWPGNVRELRNVIERALILLGAWRGHRPGAHRHARQRQRTRRPRRPTGHARRDRRVDAAGRAHAGEHRARIPGQPSQEIRRQPPQGGRGDGRVGAHRLPHDGSAWLQVENFNNDSC